MFTSSSYNVCHNNAMKWYMGGNMLSYEDKILIKPAGI